MDRSNIRRGLSQEYCTSLPGVMGTRSSAASLITLPRSMIRLHIYHGPTSRQTSAFPFFVALTSPPKSQIKTLRRKRKCVS